MKTSARYAQARAAFSPPSAGLSRHRFKAGALALAPVLGVLLLGACGQKEEAAAPGPEEVGTVQVYPQQLSQDFEISGRTVAIRTAEVRPQVTGLLQKRLFTEGRDVRAGQTLYEIDPATYKAAYDRAVANLQSTRAKAQRFGDLVNDSVVSKQQRDDAVAAWRQAEAEVEAAGVDLGRTKIRAPIAGRIGRSITTEGALVTANQPAALSTITQLDPIFVDIQESSDAMLALRRGMGPGDLSADSKKKLGVALTLEDGKPYGLEGKLSFAEVNVDQGTGMTTLRAIFPNPNHLLLPGMYVRARLTHPIEGQAYLVRQDLVMRNIHADPYVLVVGADNVVHEKLIRLGGQKGDAWVVTSGLNPGDRLVASGIQRVHEGSKVKPSAMTPASSH